jgi:glucosyl-dolichyl phosphate glucuronosyltransferase
MSAATTPLVSVVICTHNRAEYLRRSIGSVLEQTCEYPFELIVVDNASSDSTRAVTRSFERSPLIRYAYEPVIGLSHARNSGRRLARGRYIAYLDDDAIAMPGWVHAIVAAFNVTSRVGAVGGRVEPIWEAARPEWLSDTLALGLAVANWSDQPSLLRDVSKQWLVGANVAFDAKVLDELGGFDTALGRSGRRLLAGEEIVLQRRALERGYACVYYPDMHVRHVVAAARLSKDWFRRRYFWQGVSDAVMELAERSPSWPTRLFLGIRAAGGVVVHPGKVRDLLTDSDDPDEFTRRAFLFNEVGRALGLLGFARFR